MDAGDWIALGAALVALGAGVFAALSWHQARRSANASERAAAAAERSAQAEERAAAIAEQAELARNAPIFSYNAKGRSGAEAYVIATLTEGPPEVDVRTTGVWIKDEHGQWVGTAFKPEPTPRVSVNGLHPVPVDLRSHAGETTVKVNLECTEVHASEPRRWDRTATVTFSAPQQVMGTWR